MDTSIHVQPASPQQDSSLPQQDGALSRRRLLRFAFRIAVVYGLTVAVIHDNTHPHSKEFSPMSKSITSAQTTGIIGSIVAALALIVFLVTRSRRES